MPVKVIIPPAVEDDIEAIGDYIAQDNPAAAMRLIEKLYQRCQSLEHSPHRGKPYGDRYRGIREGNYVIIYRTEEADSETLVIIVTVIHGARDLQRILEL
jgi:addiction module RelE/StbE family toxin